MLENETGIILISVIILIFLAFELLFEVLKT